MIPDSYSLSLRLYPGVLTVLTTSGYSRRDEKRWLFPVLDIPGLYLILPCFQLFLDQFLNIPETDSSDSSCQTPTQGRLISLFLTIIQQCLGS